ncbi:basic proline-rich protein-like [Meles meles]|uniref:basic proline-rich protein-like n=1 Tax=Meles meles TaxID=9662 RepID=UPI001E69E70B|nr:basic proline-rich protein-like [Meles meles]
MGKGSSSNFYSSSCQRFSEVRPPGLRRGFGGADTSHPAASVGLRRVNLGSPQAPRVNTANSVRHPGNQSVPDPRPRSPLTPPLHRQVLGPAVPGPPGPEGPARIPRPRKQVGPAGTEPRGRPRRQRPSPPPRRPRPHKGARIPESKRRRQPPPPPPSSTKAVGPAPTRRSGPLPSPPRRPRRYRSRRPSPTADPPRASAPPPLGQPQVPETPPPQTGQPPRSSMGAGVREAAFVRLRGGAGTTTPTMLRVHPRAFGFPSPTDYISRQPSRLSRPPSRDTSRTGRQVGERVGFPLAAAAAAPRSDSPASPTAPAAGAASPTLLGCEAAGPGALSPGRNAPSPLIISSRGDPSRVRPRSARPPEPPALSGSVVRRPHPGPLHSRSRRPPP